MTRFNYHASQEQFSPRALLNFVQQAEAAGFDGVFSSDHLQPWAPSQGNAGFTCSWLGAALQATALPFSAITVPGGWRYHPVVLAQAIATLGVMFPGRLPWVALGSGEALNECATGRPWPDKPQRNLQLQQGAQALRSLLDGERVTSRGEVVVDDARIWLRPEHRTRLVGAAVSAETAQWLGGWAEGLLTIAPQLSTVRDIIEAFYRGGGRGKPVHLKVNINWAATDEEALAQAYTHWRFNCVRGDAATELRQPEDFELLAGRLRPQDMREYVFVSHDLGRLIAHLQARADLGVDSIDIHQVGANQSEFIEVMGSRMLPALRQRYS